MKRYTFKKEERLCNKRLIGQLFQSGSFFMAYPFRFVFLPVESVAVPAQVLISVPRKRHKRAVDRNLIKRRIREAYRIHKEEILYPFLRQQEGAGLLLAVQYIAGDLLPYPVVFNKLGQALIKLQHEYRKMDHEKDC